MSETTAPRVMSEAEAQLWRDTGNGALPDEPPPAPRDWRADDATPARREPAIEGAMKKSGLRQHFVVEMDDGAMLDVHTTIQDTLRYEKTHARRAAEADAMPVTRLLFLAWSALKRTGHKIGAFQDFESHIVELHIDDTEGDVDPTGSEPGDE